MEYKIVKATSEHIDQIAELFDAYRVFYNMDSDLSGSRSFIQERIEENSGAIFLALTEDDQAMGFTQLYHAFTSVSMRRTMILNDLYVAPAGRKQGIASALMGAAKSFAGKQGCLRLNLETGVTNLVAQSLYEKLGWTREDGEFHYSLDL